MNMDILKQNMLFHGLDDSEVKEALAHLSAGTKAYQKRDLVLAAGDVTDRMGLVLEGSVTIESNDFWGNRTVLSNVGKGQFFAETYAFLKEEVLLVDVTANERCEILFLKVGGLPQHEISATSWGCKLICNLLTISSRKNLMLSRRSFHIAPKSLRARVIAYLNSFALRSHSTEFDIPFDRQQLADYLNVDRTALSKELGRMQADGLITYRRNHFSITEFIKEDAF